MNELLDKRVSEIRVYEDFHRLLRDLIEGSVSYSFDDLWDAALRERPSHFYHLYSFLLVSLDPAPPRESKELLKEVALKGFDLSNAVLPFYMISNFGKRQIVEDLSELLASELTKNAKVNVEGVQYFVRHNPASLVEKLHYFEWVEVIEGEMFEPIA